MPRMTYAIMILGEEAESRTWKPTHPCSVIALAGDITAILKSHCWSHCSYRSDRCAVYLLECYEVDLRRVVARTRHSVSRTKSQTHPAVIFFDYLASRAHLISVFSHCCYIRFCNLEEGFRHTMFYTPRILPSSSIVCTDLECGLDVHLLQFISFSGPASSTPSAPISFWLISASAFSTCSCRVDSPFCRRALAFLFLCTRARLAIIG